MILYHGTTHDFTQIDVARGKPFKDFGQGFYATAVFDHARSLALRNRRIEESRLKAIGQTMRLTAYVYTYEFDNRALDQLNAKLFESADREWLKFVIQNRTNRERQHSYDLVVGPTANDDTRTSIRAVTNAANGAILNDNALDLLLTMLESANLPTQYYFGTHASASYLKFQKRSVVI
ncbi:hypothetical protein AGMMS49992_29130 [Clostridia bacterium]|nr:hypothetical protein AGMMS49992_29130 [Clostridia bacterium]